MGVFGSQMSGIYNNSVLQSQTGPVAGTEINKTCILSLIKTMPIKFYNICI